MTATNSTKNNDPILKVCDADKTYETWRAISVRGQAEFLTDKEEVYRILRMIALERRKEEDAFDKVAEFVLSNPGGPSLFKVPIKDLTGITHDEAS